MTSVISEEASLSRRYTIHSLRATNVHILNIAGEPRRHIMTVTRHTLEISLKQTTKSTNRLMSETLKARARSRVVSLNPRSKASSTITQSLLFWYWFPTAKAMVSIIDGLWWWSNLGWDNMYANIPMTNVPVLPTMYNCSNLTITFNISLNQLTKYIGKINKRNNSGIIN